MAHLIDKDALVAEIERRKEHYENIQMIKSGYEDNIEDFNELLSFLDNLEVKEDDLEKEIELVKGDYEQVDVAWNNDFDFIAKHFFELGLSVNNPIIAADRGIVEEIILALNTLGEEKMISYDKEIEWLNKIKEL